MSERVNELYFIIYKYIIIKKIFRLAPAIWKKMYGDYGFLPSPPGYGSGGSLHGSGLSLLLIVLLLVLSSRHIDINCPSNYYILSLTHSLSNSIYIYIFLSLSKSIQMQKKLAYLLPYLPTYLLLYSHLPLSIYCPLYINIYIYIYISFYYLSLHFNYLHM